eukprot:3406172-Prymnesium_polylepis.1
MQNEVATVIDGHSRSGWFPSLAASCSGIPTSHRYKPVPSCHARRAPWWRTHERGTSRALPRSEIATPQEMSQAVCGASQNAEAPTAARAAVGATRGRVRTCIKARQWPAQSQSHQLGGPAP